MVLLAFTIILCHGQIAIFQLGLRLLSNWCPKTQTLPLELHGTLYVFEDNLLGKDEFQITITDVWVKAVLMSKL